MQMRSRACMNGMVDMVCLVIAAHEGIKTQTIEAIRHLKGQSSHSSTELPVIVVITHWDLPKEKKLPLQKIQSQLMTQHDILLEDMGGEVQCVTVSSVTGHGLEDLKEAILAQADLLPPPHPLEDRHSGLAVVVEMKHDQKLGLMPSMIVRQGELKVGDFLAIPAHHTYTKVRGLFDENGARVESVSASTPCVVLGSWKDVDASVKPSGSSVGELAYVSPKSLGESAARELVEEHISESEQELQLEKQIYGTDAKKQVQKDVPYMQEKLSRMRGKLGNLKKIGPRNLYLQILKQSRALEAEIMELQESGVGNSSNESKKRTIELQVVVKGDVHGSVEAVVDSIKDLESLKRKSRNESTVAIMDEDIKITILHSGIGAFTPSDVDLMTASKLRQAKTISNGKDVVSRCALVGFNLPSPADTILKSLKETNAKQESPTRRGKFSTPASTSKDVKIVRHNVIYHLVDEVKDILRSAMQPDFVDEIMGEAEVLATFGYNAGKEKVVGCKVDKGVVARSLGAFSNSQSETSSKRKDNEDKSTGEIIYQIFPQGDTSAQPVWETTSLKSLKHHKKDVGVITKGMECGILFGSDVKVDLPDDIPSSYRKSDVGSDEDLVDSAGKKRGVRPGDRLVCLRRVAVPPMLEEKQ